MSDKKLVIPDTFSEAKASEIIKAFSEIKKNEDQNLIQGLSNNNNATDTNQSFASVLQAAEGTSRGSLESPGYLKVFISLVVNHGYGMFTSMAEGKLIKIMKSKLVRILTFSAK
jgi:hypothetical protein